MPPPGLVDESACLIFTAGGFLFGGCLGLLIGVVVGQRPFQSRLMQAALNREKVKEDGGWDSDEEEDELDPGDAAPVTSTATSLALLMKAATTDPVKLMLCVRKDLKMGQGKACAQCGHAAVAIYEKCRRQKWQYLWPWLRTGQAKVAVKVMSEDEMLELEQRARAAHIPTRIIHDAGRTQIAAGSATVLAIGPAPDSLLKPITGHLSLL